MEYGKVTDKKLEVVKEICEENHSLRFDSGIGREERNRLWEARYEVRESIKVNNPGFYPLVIDTAVPISKYSDMVEWGQRIVEKKGLKGYAFGHAGSGNLHMEILGIPQEKAQWQKVRGQKKKLSILHWNAAEQGRENMALGLEKRSLWKQSMGKASR